MMRQGISPSPVSVKPDQTVRNLVTVKLFCQDESIYCRLR